MASCHESLSASIDGSVWSLFRGFSKAIFLRFIGARNAAWVADYQTSGGAPQVSIIAESWAVTKVLNSQ